MVTLPITEPDPNRECGDCQACCDVLSVRPNNIDDEPELTKPFEHCQWQCEAGCGIYEHRPSPCVAYHCMWRLGAWAEDARPDRLGVVAEGSPNGWLFLVETRPGAASEVNVLAHIAALKLHPNSPCKAVNITPYGATPLESYWFDGEPEDYQEQILFLAAFMAKQQAEEQA